MHTSPARLSPVLIAVFGVAVGLMVANLYYAQPLLPQIARTFGVGEDAAARVVTWTQAGYAAGLALIVPLGDVLDRRRLTLTLLLASVLGLLAVALAPGFLLFALASLLLGLSSVGAQVLVPFAASLASEETRGRVVGTVMSGLLLGILLARTVSGVCRGCWAGGRCTSARRGRRCCWRRRCGDSCRACRARRAALVIWPCCARCWPCCEPSRCCAAARCTGCWASRPSAPSGPAWPSCWPGRRTTSTRRRPGPSGWWARWGRWRRAGPDGRPTRGEHPAPPA